MIACSPAGRELAGKPLSILFKTIRILCASLLLVSGLFLHAPGTWAANTAHSVPPGYVFEGYFSRAGNNQSPSQTVKNNIYIKLFPDQWIAMMFVPVPYASEVSAAKIDRAMMQAKKQSNATAYLRGTFDSLDQPATVHLEKYGHLEDRIVFECGSLAPCTIRFSAASPDDYLELIKPGVINEHIIKYEHVTGK